MNSEVENYISALLIEQLPTALNFASEKLKLLHNPSKTIIHANDELGIFTGERLSYYLLYIEPQTIYENYNQHFINEISKEIARITYTPPQSLKSFSKEFYKLLDSMGDELFVNFNEIDLSDEDLYFLNISFARFFDSLSLIQNKKRITDLLYEAINNGKYQNISKAVFIDPNILKIPAVTEHINTLPLNIRSQLTSSYSKAMLEPILSHSKTQKSSLALLYLCLVDSMGFIEGSLALSFKTHKSIADKVNALEQLDDIDYFNKLYRLFKKSKSQGTKFI